MRMNGRSGVPAFLVAMGALVAMLAGPCTAQEQLSEQSEFVGAVLRGLKVLQEIPAAERTTTRPEPGPTAQARTRVSGVDREEGRSGRRRSGQQVVPETPTKTRKKWKLRKQVVEGQFPSDSRTPSEDLSRIRSQAGFRTMPRKKKADPDPLPDAKPW